MANLKSKNGIHIVTIRGEEKAFLSFLNALNYINNAKEKK